MNEMNESVEFDAVAAPVGEIVERPCPKLGCVIRVKRLSAGDILRLSKGEHSSVAMVAASVMKKDGTPVYGDAKAALAEGWGKISAALEIVHQVNGIDVGTAEKN